MDPKLLAEIRYSRAAGNVTRYHTFKHIGQQTDAEHSAHALTLLLLFNPTASVNLIKAVLWHDYGELVAGDVPAPVLRRWPEYRQLYNQVEAGAFQEHFPTAWSAISQLTAEEYHWLKAVDVLELLIWCNEQVMLGNSRADAIRRKGEDYILSNPDTPAPIREFVQEYHHYDQEPA